MWKRKIAVDDALAIIKATVEAMQAAGEIRLPTPIFPEADEPVTLAPDDADFALTGGATPDWGDDEADED